MYHHIILACLTLPFFSLILQIFGFVNAISPVGNDQQNLLAFRFSALNPVVDPWVFIIFRKSVFQNVRAFVCRFSRAAVKTTPPSGLTFPLQTGGPANSTALQSKIYCSIPQWRTLKMNWSSGRCWTMAETILMHQGWIWQGFDRVRCIIPASTRSPKLKEREKQCKYWPVCVRTLTCEA